MKTASFLSTSLFRLESEFGSQCLLLLNAITGPFLDHTGCFSHFRAISCRDSVIFADLRMLLACKAGSDLVELSHDVAFLLQLLLLVVLDTLSLINLI